MCMSNKARATDEWDLSDASENVDWCSEYIARHAQLSASWLTPQSADYQDIGGAALLEDSSGKKLVGPLKDGTFCVWDLSQNERGISRYPQICQQPVRSLPGILFRDATANNSRSSQPGAQSALAFSGVADCVSVDHSRKHAYIAVGDILNEVDLNNLKVVSQTKYTWSITALSQIQTPNQPLTVGTSFGLHILDPRSHSRNRSGSSDGRSAPEDSIAFLPNKDVERNDHLIRRSQIRPLASFRTTGLDPESQVHTSISSSHMQTRRIRTFYSRLEPRPLSILHQTDHSIMVAGRFPSILNYDRRYFPRLEYVIHSSARLSALAYLPFAPRGIKQHPSAALQGTLVSCGEYNGRGSLDLYSVPHHQSLLPTDTWSNSTSTSSDSFESNNTSADPTHSTSSVNQTPPGIYSYKNRQSISSAKLLSVATHGTRIVFSDADGGLKWVERDGKSIVRRWNINSYQLHQESFPRLIRDDAGGGGASNGGQLRRLEHGEEVVRKIIPIGTGEADDLLVWTGERVGLVSFGRNQDLHDAPEDDVVRRSDGSVGPGTQGDHVDLEDRAQQYDRQMRRALERQADELNWMQRFGLRSSP